MQARQNPFRRLNARELLKNTNYGEGEMGMLDKHLTYVKAFVFKKSYLKQIEILWASPPSVSITAYVRTLVKFSSNESGKRRRNT